MRQLCDKNELDSCVRKSKVSRYIHERRIMATKKKPNKKTKNPPEEKLGDTPVPPWQMPTPQEKKQAKPVQRALKQAVAKVDSQEKADEVIEKLETAAADQKAVDVKQSEPPIDSPAQAAQQVKQKVESAPEHKKTEKAIRETAKVIAAADGREKEVLSQAVQEVMNPEQQGAAPTVTSEPQREYLRQAVLHRLAPLDALDANLFLAINHLPHTRALNAFFYTLTTIFNIVAPWYGEMGVMALRDRKNAKNIVRESLLPLLITSTLTELVIKAYFRRKRPFIAIIQAIVIGRKPGTWSFPSGHAAAAFAGAWLLNHQRPRWSLWRYFVASLVAFSRVYLGDHYPGDVASGSLVGLLSAEFFHRLLKHRSRKHK
jgi:undecaprenyl-diphosphatase